MKPRDLPLSTALTSPLASGPLDWIVTLRLSPWILGLAFFGLPRLAQAQDVTSGTAIYTTNWAGGTISPGATLRLDNGGTVSGNVTNAARSNTTSRRTSRSATRSRAPGRSR
jgi:hypothetical protein